MSKIKINSDCTSIRRDVEPKDILLFSSRKANWFNYSESKVKHSHNLPLIYPSAWHMPRRNSCIRRLSIAALFIIAKLISNPNPHQQEC